MACMVEKPLAAAILCNGSFCSSSSRRAASTRASSTYAAGVDVRLSREGACEIALAHGGFAREPPHREIGAQVLMYPAQRVLNGLLGENCAANWALNCDCPPGRLRNKTKNRATASAVSRPRSSSTSASMRSNAAVTPAELNMLPSRTKMRSGSTMASGWRVANSSANCQWVVTRRPLRVRPLPE